MEVDKHFSLEKGEEFLDLFLGTFRSQADNPIDLQNLSQKYNNGF